MTKNIFIPILLLAASPGIRAQTQFLTHGKIEFERKINVHRQFDVSEDDSWFKDYVSKLPKFNSTNFDLYFSANKTLYKPADESSQNSNSLQIWGLGPAKDNIIVTNLDHHEIKSRKKVYEETFVVNDSTRHVNWRITDEIRTIAGFDCRKAVGIICDSVYVVAFYTDEIAVSGGPESFNGLPGMILGLAIPRLYTTWFATKVELVTPADKDFAVPVSRKSKQVSREELLTTLEGSALKSWGKQGQRYMWWVML